MWNVFCLMFALFLISAPLNQVCCLFTRAIIILSVILTLTVPGILYFVVLAFTLTSTASVLVIVCISSVCKGSFVGSASLFLIHVSSQ